MTRTYNKMYVAYANGTRGLLNPNTMRGRLIFEAWDAGLTEFMYKNLTPPVYPGLGTMSDYLHLVQPLPTLLHQEPTPVNSCIAPLF